MGPNGAPVRQIRTALKTSDKTMVKRKVFEFTEIGRLTFTAAMGVRNGVDQISKSIYGAASGRSSCMNSIKRRVSFFCRPMSGQTA